jgi:hypothetical protein
MVVVWDRPERINLWEEVIRAHDMPVDPVLSRRTMPSDDGYDFFVGTWVDEDGNVIYRISVEEGGDLHFETWKAEPWTVSIKNLRAENGSIFFDQYHYTPPSEKLETNVDKSGEHPFSGVRCNVELSRIEGDDKAIRFTMSSIHLEEPTQGVLRKQD